MLISPPRRLQIMGMHMIANCDIGGGVADRHSVLNNRVALFDGSNGNLMAERNFFRCGNRHGGIVFHTPAIELFTRADIFNRDAYLVLFSMNDETNHLVDNSPLWFRDL